MRKERKIINTNIRLNLCEEQDRMAWEYLQTMDREKYKSYTKAVVAALNDYFSRMYRNEADPYLETREKLNQSLQQSNDDLRNRNGLQSRREQEQLEEEIRNFRDQNSKLELLVNASSIEAVSAVQKKQKEAEKKIRIIESRMKTEQGKAKAEIKRELEKRNKKIKEKEFLWGLGYVILTLLTVIMK